MYATAEQFTGNKPPATPISAQPARWADGAPLTQGWINPLVCQLLDLISTGLLLVDADARVLHANRAARSTCHELAPVALAGQQLRMAPAERARLDAALRLASRRQWSMLVFRHGKACLSMAVVPMRDPAAHPTLVAALVTGAGNGPSSLALQFFSQTHQLTAAESGVLSGLCCGQRPSQIAQVAGVAVCTVRTQIAAIRSKTQSSSIGELMHLVSALPPIAPKSLVDGFDA